MGEIKGAHSDICKSCTCGLTKVYWSDREGFYKRSDLESIVNVVISCCLDHHYDRTENGIPYLVDIDIENILEPEILKWFANNKTEWFNRTIILEDFERKSLKEALLSALNKDFIPILVKEY